MLLRLPVTRIDLIGLYKFFGEVADLTAFQITVNKQIERDQRNNELTVISLVVQSVMRVIKGPRSHLTHCHDTHYHTRHVTCARSHTRTTLSERTGPRGASELTTVALRRVPRALRALPSPRHHATCGGTATHRLPHNLAAYST